MNLLPLVIHLITLLSLASCTSETPKPQKNRWVSVGRAAAGDISVELGTDTRLETGLTPIHVKLTTPNGDAISDARVGFEPLMSMSSGKQHACPIIGEPVVADDGIYHTAVVFQMPSSDMDTWSATVRISESDAEVNMAAFPDLPVADSGRAQTFVYQQPATGQTQKYVASLNLLAPPRVGLNPVVFTLHEMKDMMTFEPVEDAMVALDPQMPAMGHGSPGSIDPSPTTLGRYEGQLSFSMLGTWETTVTITRAGTVLSSPKFVTAF